jgi:hypothetical protein
MVPSLIGKRICHARNSNTTVSDHTCAQAHTHTHTQKGAQILRARLPLPLKFVWWCLMFTDTQYGDGFTSFFCHLKLKIAHKIFGKSVHLMHVDVCAQACMYAHTHARAHAYTRVHTHTHTH